MKIIRRVDIGNILRGDTVVDLYVFLTRLIYEWIKQAKAKTTYSNNIYMHTNSSLNNLLLIASSF